MTYECHQIISFMLTLDAPCTSIDLINACVLHKQPYFIRAAYTLNAYSIHGARVRLQKCQTLMKFHENGCVYIPPGYLYECIHDR